MAKSIRVGCRVRTATDLPGIPAGTEGVVAEVGRVFVAVQFADRRIGYYAPRQLVVSLDRQLLPLVQVAGSPAPAAGSAGLPGQAVSPLCPSPGSDWQVPNGAHLCLLPEPGDDPLQVTAQYLGAGMEAGDVCLAVIPPAWRDGLLQRISALGHRAVEAVASGQLALLDTWDYYLRAEVFSADHQIERLRAVLHGFAQGGRPVRAFGHVGPVVAAANGAEWWDYERRIAGLLADVGALVLCAYADLPSGSPACTGARSCHQYLISGGQLSAL